MACIFQHLGDNRLVRREPRSPERMLKNHLQSFRASLVAQTVKNPPANAGDVASIPGSGRSPGERNDNPLQHSCLGNPMDKGIWWATVHGGHKRVRHDFLTKQLAL